MRAPKRGPRFQPSQWAPRNRRERRWQARVTRYAADTGLAALPDESSSSLRLRMLERVSPGARKMLDQFAEVQQAHLAAVNPLTATGNNLTRLAAAFGVQRHAPAEGAGIVTALRAHP